MTAKLIGLLVALILVARADAGIAQTSSATAPSKLWVTDLPSYLNEHPRQQWVVGHCDQPALSADEAETMARRDAAVQIAAAMGLSNGYHTRSQTAAWIDASIRRGDWIVDRQIDATERPYGTIWRAAILVNADPKKLDTLVRQMHDARDRKRAHAMTVIVVSVVWLMAVSIGYSLLNWLTRGYFRGRLALVSVILVAAGIAVMWHA